MTITPGCRPVAAASFLKSLPLMVQTVRSSSMAARQIVWSAAPLSPRFLTWMTSCPSSHNSGTSRGDMHSSRIIRDINGPRAPARPTDGRMRLMIKPSEFNIVCSQVGIIRENALGGLTLGAHFANMPHRQPSVLEHRFTTERALFFFNAAQTVSIQIDARRQFVPHLVKINEQGSIDRHSIAARDQIARLLPNPAAKQVVAQHFVLDAVSRDQQSFNELP